MNHVKRIEKEMGGETYRLTITPDEFYGSPREWGVGTMVCWHRNYNLGDEQPKEAPTDWLLSLSDLSDEDRDSPNGATLMWEKIKSKYVILPLYLYDHSGVSISVGKFSCPWDSGQVGWIYCSHERAKKEWGDNWEEKAMKHLEGEVKTYNQYLQGEIFSFCIEKKEVCNLGHDHWNMVDACGGFYGYDFKENGMLDHFSTELQPLFKEEL